MSRLSLSYLMKKYIMHDEKNNISRHTHIRQEKINFQLRHHLGSKKRKNAYQELQENTQ